MLKMKLKVFLFGGKNLTKYKKKKKRFPFKLIMLQMKPLKEP